MGTKKLSLKNSSQKIKKEIIKEIKKYEKQTEFFEDKLKGIEKNLKKKRDIKWGKLPFNKQKKFELNIIKLKNNLETLKDEFNEVENSLWWKTMN